MREQTWCPGSAAVVDYILRPGGPRLSAEARLIYLALFSHMDDQHRCHPSVSRLAEGTGLSDRTVQRRIQELHDAGLIRRIEIPGRVSEYQLYPPWAPLSTTPDRESPVTESHPRHSDTAPATESHPTPVSVTPEVTHRSNPGSNPVSPSIHPADEDARVRGRVWMDVGPPERWAVATAMATRFEPAEVLERLRRCRALQIADGALVVAPPDDAAVKDDLRRLRPKLQAALRIDKRAALDLIILEPEYEARAGPADDQLFQRSDTG